MVFLQSLTLSIWYVEPYWYFTAEIFWTLFMLATCGVIVIWVWQIFSCRLVYQWCAYSGLFQLCLLKCLQSITCLLIEKMIMFDFHCWDMIVSICCSITCHFNAVDSQEQSSWVFVSLCGLLFWVLHYVGLVPPFVHYQRPSICPFLGEGTKLVRRLQESRNMDAIFVLHGILEGVTYQSSHKRHKCQRVLSQSDCIL
jgi:hypothetical protein